MGQNARADNAGAPVETMKTDDRLQALAARALVLFVPGDRPERFAKALAAGADAVIIDLEDAVAPAAKVAARSNLAAALEPLAGAAVPILLRVNAADSNWNEEDVAAAARLPVAGVMLPKAERPSDLAAVAEALGSRERVIALIESARGIAAARMLAAECGRLAFGSIDYAADLGAGHTRESLLLARAELVLASRLAGLPGPLDGVTQAIDDAAAIEADTVYAATLGFAGKLLIHPKQVAPALRGFRPSDAEIAWAGRVIAAMQGGAVAVVDGAMVDAPVRLRAERILRRAR